MVDLRDDLGTFACVSSGPEKHMAQTVALQTLLATSKKRRRCFWLFSDAMVGREREHVEDAAYRVVTTVVTVSR
jgi:hypothetical protein